MQYVLDKINIHEEYPEYIKNECHIYGFKLSEVFAFYSCSIFILNLRVYIDFYYKEQNVLYTTTFYVDDTNIKYRINPLWDVIQYPIYMEDFHL